MEPRGRSLLTVAGSLVVLYSVVSLCFVATCPDLRLRCLLVDEQQNQSALIGVQIRKTPNLEPQGLYPRPGDVLVRVGEQSIRSFLDFSRQSIELYRAEIGRDAHLHAGADPSELDPAYSLPKLVEIDDGPRMVEIEYRKQGTNISEKSWLALHSLPIGEIVLSIVWFLLQLGVLIVGAVAFWNRPFDRPVRLFFAMTIVALGASMGVQHWWVLAGSLWLLLPFAVCATLLPAVTLHFFLVFPRPKSPISSHPTATCVGLYATPLLAIVGLFTIFAYTSWLNQGQAVEQHVDLLLSAFGLLKRGIYAYLVVSAIYFVLTLGSLVLSFVTTRNPVERNQVKWILWAALLATIPVGFALYSAQFDRIDFALGGATLPMFIASLLFMTAYAVAIARHKLMLVDQIVSKGMLYYVVSIGLTVTVSVLIAVSSLLDGLIGVSLSTQQSLAVGAILMLSVMLLLWLRDRFQQMIDQRFFREKYQLDRALKRMNRAVGYLADPEPLGEMMLSSCRDVLGVQRAAFYLRSPPESLFQLVAVEGSTDMPISFAADPELLSTLSQAGSLQRITPGTRSAMSPVQNVLRELHADLVHALDMDEEIAALVVLGGKKNGASFTAEDLTFLNALGQITNVALHSAKVHQDLTRLHEELQAKVEQIVSQNRRIAMLQAELTDTQELPRRKIVPPAHKDDFSRDAIKGNSPAIRELLATVRKVAASDSSVLILGESGTGKELLAQILHENSPRRSGPMVRVHCASLSPNLLESELFGHVKGAFTGAHRDKVGRFEAADGGTLFLDEIGDISLETQIKLLRVLQERCFQPVGGMQTIQVDVRLITATHQVLERLISEGRFREDLFYRLNVIRITMPPLRERKEDILELSLYFLNRSAQRLGKRITRIDDEVMTALEQYHWPGNVRELGNAIERAVVLADNDEISLHDLPAEITGTETGLPSHVVETKPLVASWAPVRGVASHTSERKLLQQALQQCNGNKAQAARLLGLPRSTYYSKLKKLTLD